MRLIIDSGEVGHSRNSRSLSTDWIRAQFAYIFEFATLSASNARNCQIPLCNCKFFLNASINQSCLMRGNLCQYSTVISWTISFRLSSTVYCEGRKMFASKWIFTVCPIQILLAYKIPLLHPLHTHIVYTDTHIKITERTIPEIDNVSRSKPKCDMNYTGESMPFTE